MSLVTTFHFGEGVPFMMLLSNQDFYAFFFATMKYNNRPTDKKLIHLHYFSNLYINKKVNNLFLLLIGYMEKL